MTSASVQTTDATSPTTTDATTTTSDKDTSSTITIIKDTNTITTTNTNYKLLRNFRRPVDLTEDLHDVHVAGIRCLQNFFFSQINRVVTDVASEFNAVKGCRISSPSVKFTHVNNRGRRASWCLIWIDLGPLSNC
jgi:hypothetical protein